MIVKLKKVFYFPIARYFLFFASLRLKRWRPTVIVVTGSNGKTTLLHLLESQLHERARYSHRANGVFGIAFHILDLKRETLLKREWISLFLLAPIRAFRNAPKEKLYIIEVDCDRPNEGKVISSLLEPDIVLWLSVSRTHTINFDRLIFSNGIAPRLDRGFAMTLSAVEEAVAYEFGYLLEHCKKLAIVNGDNPLILGQLKRVKASIIRIERKSWLSDYSLYNGKTVFEMKGKKYAFPFLLPEETFYAIVMCKELLGYLRIEQSMDFSKFVMPPGRSSVFKGIKGTTIIDSTYNATPASVAAILSMFGKYKTGNKWIVLSDMVELGKEEKEEHEKLADLLSESNADRIILMGPRMGKYTYPVLSQKLKAKSQKYNLKVKSGEDESRDVIIENFLTPREVLEYLEKNLHGGETILFKGARFLEGVIEHLLQDKKDIARLPRREEVWEIRRKGWGL